MDYASSILGFLPGGRRSTGISQLLDKLETYLPPAQIERVRDAYEFGAQRHQGQKRLSGEAYITHPVAVADILADLRMDADTLVAAILHDVIEDTPTAKAEIAAIFGQIVAELVDGVSKLDQIQFKNRQEAQAESFRKMLLAMVRDIRVIMVKLADRMHNMRTLGVMPPVKRRVCTTCAPSASCRRSSAGAAHVRHWIYTRRSPSASVCMRSSSNSKTWDSARCTPTGTRFSNANRSAPAAIKSSSSRRSPKPSRAPLRRRQSPAAWRGAKSISTAFTRRCKTRASP